MPFLSYSTPDEALENAGRFLQDGGAQAVKIEGGVRSARIVETLVRAGIPTMGHIGWTPQAKHGMGGKVRVQGKSRDQARALLHDALAIQEAGAFAMVLELVPEAARRRHHRSGCASRRSASGPGAGCSGQVLVVTDLLGLGLVRAPPRAPVRQPPRDDPRGAATAYAADVVAGTFPGPEHATKMDEEVLAEVLGQAGADRPSGSEAPAGGIPLDRDL